MPDHQTLITGLVFGESPRWHDGRLLLCNWGAQEVVAVDSSGRSEVDLHVPTSLPFSIDWLPDGRHLIVSGPERLVHRHARGPDRADGRP
jgi:sugar lactone lactonase YvrE